MLERSLIIGILGSTALLAGRAGAASAAAPPTTNRVPGESDAVTKARKAVADAEKTYLSAQLFRQVAAAGVDAAVDDLERTRRDVETAQAALTRGAQQIAAAESDADAARNAAADRRREADATRRAKDVASAGVLRTTRALDDAVTVERKAFLATPSALKLETDITVAEARQKIAREARLDTLFKTSTYSAADKRLRIALDQLEKLRGKADADPDRLATASKNWIAAKGEKDGLERDALKFDPAHGHALEAVALAKQNRKDAAARFEADLLTAPALLPLREAFAKATDNLSNAVAINAAAAGRANEADHDYASAQETLSSLRSRLVIAQNLAAAAGATIAVGDVRIANARRGLEDAILRERVALKALEDARRALRLALGAGNGKP